jgi:hypothetical protein
VSYECSILIL